MSALHQDQPRLHAGAPLQDADAVVVLLHGRGDSAQGILGLVPVLANAGVAFLAPQAANHSWYPQRFIAPLAMNEPWLTSALQAVGDGVAAARAEGFDDDQIVLGGFSQGACLALEYAGRYAGRLGGVFALSGGLIGPTIEPERHHHGLAGTPVFLGCSDRDLHIPLERVHASAELMGELGGEVTEHIYPNLGHTVNADEISQVQAILNRLTDTSAADEQAHDGGARQA